jgi:hypothetical protein
MVRLMQAVGCTSCSKDDCFGSQCTYSKYLKCCEGVGPFVDVDRKMSENTQELQLPLGVDCDGTLIKTDLLFEAFCALLKQSPGTIFLLPFWLLAFSMFIFLSLALVKRYSELSVVLKSGKAQASGRGYRVDDLPLLESLGTASGYMAVLGLALYINSADVIRLYSQPRWLWLLCPLLLCWIGHIWIKTHRGEMHDDPVIFAVQDRSSWSILALGACGLYLAMW